MPSLGSKSTSRKHLTLLLAQKECSSALQALAPDHPGSGWGVGGGSLARGLSPQGTLISLLRQRAASQGGGKESLEGRRPRHLFLGLLLSAPVAPPAPCWR